MHVSWAHAAFGVTSGMALSGGVPRSQPCVGSGGDSYQAMGHTGGKEKVAPGTLMGEGGCPPPREEEGESCATAPFWHPVSLSPSPSSSPTHAHTPTRPGAFTLVFHSQGAPGSSKTGGLVSKAKAWPAASLGREQPRGGLSQRLSLLLAHAPALSPCWSLSC